MRKLSQNQHAVLAGIAAGKMNKTIAFELGIGESSVKTHVLVCFQKLGVRNRVEAAMCYLAGLDDAARAAFLTSFAGKAS